MGHVDLDIRDKQAGLEFLSLVGLSSFLELLIRLLTCMHTWIMSVVNKQEGRVLPGHTIAPLPPQLQQSST